MSEFTIHQANYMDGRLHEVLILCRDEPEPPVLFYEETVVPVQDVLNHLKEGYTVWAQWEAYCFPIVRVNLPNGEETIEVVQQGQPAAYRTLAGLPCEERVFSA